MISQISIYLFPYHSITEGIMSTKYTAKADLDSTDLNCPFCGKPYLRLEYYTATSVPSDGNGEKLENATKHLGGLCPYCYKEKRNKKLIPILAVIGGLALGFFIYAIILPLIGVIPVDRYEYFGGSHVKLFGGLIESVGWSNPLVIFGFLSGIPAAISFGVIGSLASFKPEKLEEKDARLDMFYCLRTENNLPPDLVFKTPDDARRLGLMEKNTQN